MSTCSTCVHFRPNPPTDDYDGAFGWCAFIPSTATSARESLNRQLSCDLMSLLDQWAEINLSDEDDEKFMAMGNAAWMEHCHPDALAFTDAGQFASSLHVHPDFGCAHHATGQ